MAFHDQRLPENVERDTQGGPSFSTVVQTTKAGVEYRSANWTRPRHRWNAGYGVQTIEAVQELLDFFYCRRGRLHSFRFRDWSDYQAVNEPLGISDGIQTDYQLVKVYQSGAQSFTRVITKPIEDTVEVRANNVVVAHTVDALTGVVTIGPQAIGAAITASFEFDIPVRFDTDQFEAVLKTVQAGEVPDIPLVEVLE